MEKFKEKKWISVLIMVSAVLSLVWVFSALGMAFEYTQTVSFVVFFTTPFLIGILLAVHSVFETREKYTREFLDYYWLREKECKTKKQFEQLYQEIYDLATEDNIIKLSFPLSIKELLKTISDKVEVLNRVEN